MVYGVVARPKVMWQLTDGHPSTSWDGGETWHFTFRSLQEFREMHGEVELVSGEAIDDLDDSAERELFGETLDDPIPDFYWEMIKGCS